MTDPTPGPGATTADGGEGRSAPEQVADLFLYAPLGLALEARRLLPEMAARGRRQILFTRTVGRFAVRRGRQRLDDLIGTGVGLLGVLLPGGDDATPESDPELAARQPAIDAASAQDRAEAPRPDPEHLAIPDYDSLSAFQVMPRLEALEAGDLDAVRAYEESTRGRRTILNKIAQLS